MPAIGQIETFVADGEIGNFLISECHRQTKPVVERRINDTALGNIALSVSDHDLTKFSAPGLSQSKSDGIPLQWRRNRC